MGQALKMIAGAFEGAVYDADPDCQETMHEASMFAGMGFGNAGVHLCHGLAVCITAPAVFEKCALSGDDETAKRCLEGAHALTGDNLIKGAMPQRRVLDLSPIEVDEDVVGNLFMDSL